MSDDERDKLVVDVADAITLNQAVDWERCVRQATAANRRALDNLRLIAGVFAGVRVAGDASTSAGPETRAGVVVRVAVRALLAVAAVEVAWRGRPFTVRYLSPEVLSSQPAEEADDVWSLCVVLHEMVSGEHPFAGADEVTSRIRRQRPGRSVEAAGGSASAVLAFTTSRLTATRSARPSTARAFAAALRRAGERA